MNVYLYLGGELYELSKESATQLAHYVLKNGLYMRLRHIDVEHFGKQINRTEEERKRTCADVQNRDCLYWDKEDWLMFLMECCNPKTP